VLFLAGSSFSSSALGYQPCVQSNQWYVSQPSIRCSTSFAATGFAPDPKDCSKYYACDSFVGPDGMSAGKTKVFIQNILDCANNYLCIQVF
jgi:hypothetical protein